MEAFVISKYFPSVGVGGVLVGSVNDGTDGRGEVIVGFGATGGLDCGHYNRAHGGNSEFFNMRSAKLRKFNAG
ncbi:hypothetical protein NCPHL90_00912 [Corynebacterium diphtheriae]|uniref:hypothetical protein n=1 Tax=Corynebacterium diphtheriae TaxID=1717 RepID=UPI000424F836|nr:hypothetical protein [Corynebacterium diphtheriae]CAB0506212.1 hypothetical protein CIP107506_01085 [Corynebacterium diphtheriae]CAB0724266.1 hypothetical protein FRC0089_00948 [Corynebacterium diphtheriae]VVH29499.1 hypothetical protein NCPHL90_00912 [Corynebacterium diphtheriae]